MRPSHRPRALATCLLAVAVLVGSAGLGGCGADPDAGPSGTGADLKAVDVNPTDRDDVADGGTLRWAVEQYSTQWNYHHLDGPNDGTQAVLGAVMPTLFHTDEKAVPTPNEAYLTAAEVTATSPKQVITYKINPQAKWSDGKPLLWTDFEAQAMALAGRDGKFQIASSTGYEQVESVARGADDREVKVTFATPFAEWQSLFDPLYPASATRDATAFNTGYVEKIPVTGGPFKLEKLDPTTKTVTVVRDPAWWGDPAKLERIVYRSMEVDAAVNAFANGEVDTFEVGASASDYKRASGVQGAALRKAAGPDYRHFTVNGASPILADEKVRRAVAMAINREAITKSDLQGLDWPAVTLDNHFFVNTQEGYRDNSGEVGEFNPDRARQLLDEAGWKLNGTTRVKDGKPLSLRFVIPAGVPVSKQEGELTQAMLADVGVKLEIQTVPADPFFDKYVTPGNFDLTPFSWIGTPYPNSASKSIFANPRKDAAGELQIQQNYARTGSAEIDALMQRAISELDPAKARDLLNQADAKIWEKVHTFTLYQRPQIVATKANLANFGAFGFKTRVYTDIGFAKG